MTWGICNCHYMLAACQMEQIIVDSSTAEADLSTGALVSQTVVGPCQSSHLQAEVPNDGSLGSLQRLRSRSCLVPGCLPFCSFCGSPQPLVASVALLRSGTLCSDAHTSSCVVRQDQVGCSARHCLDKAVQARSMHRLGKDVNAELFPAGICFANAYTTCKVLIQEPTNCAPLAANLASPPAAVLPALWQGPVASPLLLLLASHGAIHEMQQRKPANLWQEA